MTNTEALKLAYGMLASIENGKSYTAREWDYNLALIEYRLGILSPRSQALAANIKSGQATL
jgi:hypothetical protein